MKTFCKAMLFLSLLAVSNLALAITAVYNVNTKEIYIPKLIVIDFDTSEYHTLADVHAVINGVNAFNARDCNALPSVPAVSQFSPFTDHCLDQK